MKPIGILQHEAGVTAGHFLDWARERGLPVQIIEIDCGQRVPQTAAAYSGLNSLGGNMSVNDALPWIGEELALMRDAVERAVPVIGHCLGGQLLARALGAPVRRHSVKEMGWLPVAIDQPALAREWFGIGAPVSLFHWHGDAFDLPPGSERVLSSPLTPNQAFVLTRDQTSHVGMQFHIEMTPELVRSWASEPAAEREVAEERARTGGPGVQSPAEMVRDVEAKTQRVRPLAWHLYDRWARSLKR